MPEVTSIWFRILYAGLDRLERCSVQRFSLVGACQTAGSVVLGGNAIAILRSTRMGEIFNAAILSSTLILVGLGLGFLMLKIQGGEE